MKKIESEIAHYIVDDLRPFYAIEGEGLKSLIQSVIDCAYKHIGTNSSDIMEILPSRNTLRKHLTIKASDAITNIKNELQKALEFPGEFGISMDLWKDNHKGVHYNGITAHINIVENNNIVRKSFVCHCSQIIDLTKTNQVLRESVTAVFEKYGIEPNIFAKRVERISDRGSNVVLALSKNGEIRFNCYCHLINNLLSKMCSKDARIAYDVIHNSSELVNYMKTSGMNAFLPYTLKSFVSTRWNIVFYMIESICKVYNDIHELLLKKENETRTFTYVRKLTCIDHDDLIKLITFLKPFKEMSVNLEYANKITLHQVWPTFNLIKENLEEEIDDDQIIKEMKSIGRNYFELNKEDFEPHMEHKLACFMHPLMKCKIYLN